MKQVICIKWGEKYGPEYVNRLYGMLSRHLTPPFRLICFTDDETGLRPEIEPRPMPEFDYTPPKNTLGKWPKSRLWGDLGDITGVVLFIDLDVVITGSMDGFFEFGEQTDVILARNSSAPLERLGQTSIYRMPVGKLEPLQRIFAADPQGTADKYRFEQRFVTRNAPGGVKFWPKGWVVQFRWHCIPPVPLNYVRAPALPRDARVVIFPGGLNPPDAIAGRWTSRDTHRAPGDHLRATFDGRRREGLSRHLRHYFLPAPWVAEHWQE